MKRYELQSSSGHTFLLDDDDGSWVRYDDAAAEIARLTEENAALRAAIWTALDNAHDKSAMIAALSRKNKHVITDPDTPEGRAEIRRIAKERFGPK